MPAAPSNPTITGVVLAGGRGQRMGGLDKGLIEIAGRPLIDHVLRRLTPQVHAIMVSANRNLESYGRYGVEIVTDQMADHQGPLVGMLAAMRAARTEWIVTVPCDGPLLARDLVQRLVSVLPAQQPGIAIATLGEERHYVYTLQPVALAQLLSDFIASGGRRARDWIDRYPVGLADLTDQPQSLLNINFPLDLEQAARFMIDEDRPMQGPSAVATRRRHTIEL
ncbi:MAG: molybdenum cofactor guanylyltransferase [Sphingobacteriia bacterium]|nr:molybdenum cofactor guanylyltransferase [Sphingobacteriia bacterium]NCC38963.1 molybdenum cofactor guanylyltransferase [Gammaproteobacteria bacterium]